MSDPFVKFFSAVEGFLVSRYGTGIELGATRKSDGSIQWDESVVYAITADEMRRYRREYANHVALGELRERSRADFEAFIAPQETKRESANTED